MCVLWRHQFARAQQPPMAAASRASVTEWVAASMCRVVRAEAGAGAGVEAEAGSLTNDPIGPVRYRQRFAAET